MRWAAMLRSINAGKPLVMADLRGFLADQGMAEVRTLLASGNAVFTADDIPADALARTLAAAARTSLALDTDWFLRTRAELERVIVHDPFPDAARDRPSHLVVVFHHAALDVPQLRAFAHGYHGPERLHAHGRELYVDFVAGIGRSKLTPAMAKARLPAVSTARNWNTVRKITAAM